MGFPDGQNASDYTPLAGFSGAQWAWQFLRRNPRYQAEWEDFNTTWQALEAEYGRPPDRDFCAWKLDARAWIDVSECEVGDCRVDQHKVLIECALGARWGFHKFPPAPSVVDAVGSGLLTWRDTPREPVVVGPQDRAWLGTEPARVALGFDLSWPLREQIDQAKRQLQLLQRQRRREGKFTAVSARRLGPALAEMVRLLDAVTAGASERDCGVISAQWRVRLAHAIELRDGGYRELPRLPD